MRDPQLEAFLYRLVDKKGVKCGVFNGVHYQFVFVDNTPRFKRVMKGVFRHIFGRKKKAESEAY